jgi:hypothetical protein
MMTDRSTGRWNPNHHPELSAELLFAHFEAARRERARVVSTLLGALLNWRRAKAAARPGGAPLSGAGAGS